MRLKSVNLRTFLLTIIDNKESNASVPISDLMGFCDSHTLCMSHFFIVKFHSWDIVLELCGIKCIFTHFWHVPMSLTDFQIHNAMEHQIQYEVFAFGLQRTHTVEHIIVMLLSHIIIAPDYNGWWIQLFPIFIVWWINLAIQVLISSFCNWKMNLSLLPRVIIWEYGKLQNIWMLL